MGDIFGLDIQLVALFIAIGLILALGVYQLVIYSTTQHHGRRSAGAMGSIFVALALIVLQKNVTIALAQWTGLNNIGWYLGYVMGTFGCYLFAQLAYITDIHRYGPAIYRMLRIAFISLLLLMTTIYLAHILHMSERPAYTPRTVWELAFSVAYFSYCAGITVAVAMTVWQAIPKEENPAQRLRLWLGFFGNLSAMTCFLGRVVYLNLYHFYADLLWIDEIALLSLAFSGLWFCLSMSPGWFLRLIVALNPLRYLYQVWQVFWLRRLSARVYTLMPAQVWRQYYLRRELRHTQLSIYRYVIAILDGKKHLARCLNMDPQRQQRTAGLIWNRDQRAQAASLHLHLQHLEKLRDTEYPQLVRAVVRISQQKE